MRGTIDNVRQLTVQRVELLAPVIGEHNAYGQTRPEFSVRAVVWAKVTPLGLRDSERLATFGLQLTDEPMFQAEMRMRRDVTTQLRVRVLDRVANRLGEVVGIEDVRGEGLVMRLLCRELVNG